MIRAEPPRHGCEDLAVLGLRVRRVAERHRGAGELHGRRHGVGMVLAHHPALHLEHVAVVLRGLLGPAQVTEQHTEVEARAEVHWVLDAVHCRRRVEVPSNHLRGLRELTGGGQRVAERRASRKVLRVFRRQLRGAPAPLARERQPERACEGHLTRCADSPRVPKRSCAAAARNAHSRCTLPEEPRQPQPVGSRPPTPLASASTSSSRQITHASRSSRRRFAGRTATTFLLANRTAMRSSRQTSHSSTVPNAPLSSALPLSPAITTSAPGTSHSPPSAIARRFGEFQKTWNVLDSFALRSTLANTPRGGRAGRNGRPLS